MSRLETAKAAYVVTFRVMPPEPFGIDDDHITVVLEQAVADGKPVPESFDWWAHLPPDAAA